MQISSLFERKGHAEQEVVDEILEVESDYDESDDEEDEWEDEGEDEGMQYLRGWLGADQEDPDIEKGENEQEDLPTRTETQEKRKGLPFRPAGRLSKEGERVAREQPGDNADPNEEVAKGTGPEGEVVAEQKAEATDQRDGVGHCVM
jgi:hypothetical protein